MPSGCVHPRIGRRKERRHKPMRRPARNQSHVKAT